LIISKVLLSSNLFSLFSPSIKINQSSLAKENYRNKFSKIQIGKIMFEKKNPKMIQIQAFKKKKKEGGEGRPQLGGLWKVSMLGGL
jgi:hypothetical protein